MNGILYVVYLVVVIYGWMIVARAVLSWFRVRPGTLAYRISSVLFQLTEPYLALLRRLLAITRIGALGIDWSMLLGLVVLFVVAQLITSL